MGERTSLARRAASADDGEHVKYAKDASELGWTDNTLAVRGHREELVEWPGTLLARIVDVVTGIYGLSGDSVKALSMTGARRSSASATGCCCLQAGSSKRALRSLCAFRRCTSGRNGREARVCGLYAQGQPLCHATRRGPVRAGCYRTACRVLRPWRCVSIPRGRLTRLYAAVARGRECAFEHRHHALTLAPEVLCWQEGGACECE